MSYEEMELFFPLSSEYTQKTLLMRNGLVADTRCTVTLHLNFQACSLYVHMYTEPIKINQLEQAGIKSPFLR